MVEPRQDEGGKAAGRPGVEGRRTTTTEAGEERPKTGNKDKLEGFLKGSTFSLKSLGAATQDGASD